MFNVFIFKDNMFLFSKDEDELINNSFWSTECIHSLYEDFTKKMIEHQNSILKLFLKDREAGEKISQNSVNYCFSF